MAALYLFVMGTVDVQATQAGMAAGQTTAGIAASGKAYTVTAHPTWYVETVKESYVYLEPFADAAVIGVVPAETIFIVTGAADNGWCQVCYKGFTGYMTPADLTVYLGGEAQTALPALSTTENYRVNFLGDSITYGDELADRNQSYASLLAGMMQASAYGNYGLNASCMGGANRDRFVDRFGWMSPEADLVVVFGGTNDYEFATPIGTMKDRDSATFCGSLNLLMCSLQQMYPEAEIVFLTPIRRDYGTNLNATGNVLEDYVYAIMNLGEFYDIPVVDLYHAKELNFVGSRYYLVDGLHPTAAGHKIMANYIFGQLFVPEV